MDTAGSMLKTEREKQGKTLDAISSATKINKSVLKLIEEDSYGMLPSSSYVRGFLKLYARELGIEPYTVIELYEQFLKGSRKEAPDKNQAPPPYVKKRNNPLITVIVILFVLIISGLGYRFCTVEKTPSHSISASTTTVVDVAVPEDVSTTVPAAALPYSDNESSAQVPSATGIVPSSMKEEESGLGKKENFTVRFVARELTWMKIEVDDDKPFEVMLRAGEVFRKTAARSMKVRIGNGGGVSLFYNGVPLGVPGRQGKTLNLRFPEYIDKLQQ